MDRQRKILVFDLAEYIHLHVGLSVIEEIHSDEHDGFRISSEAIIDFIDGHSILDRTSGGRLDSEHLPDIEDGAND